MVPPKPRPEPPPDRPSVVGPAEVRQRWRLTVRRAADVAPTTSKEVLAAWEARLVGSGLPIAGLDLPAPRPRIVFGAPLGAGMPAERELIDIFLVERWAVGPVRTALVAALPPGHELLDLHDVWLGEPALPGQVAAADYRVRVRAVDGRALDLATLQAAGEQLILARALPRSRDKGGRQVPYDLRPLVAAATAASIDPGGLATLRIRTRFDPERGVGRPEEVVAAIGELAAISLEVVDMVRERLLLIGDL